MSSRLPALSLTVKVTAGLLSGLGIVSRRRWRTRGRRVAVERVATVCAPLMDASNSVSPCGWWHWAHWLSLTCGQVDVILAGGEVHVVVAGAAGGARRGAGELSGLGSLLVADRAGLQLVHTRREADVGEVRPCAAMPDAVRASGDHAGKILAHVDFVDQHRHVLAESRVSGLMVCGVWQMNAEFHGDARSAVADQRIVAADCRPRWEPRCG